MERNRRLLNLRHPGYDALVEDFIQADPARPIRRRLDEARLVAQQGNCVLLVTLSLPGGVDRFVRERRRDLRARGLRPITLQPTESGPPGCLLSIEGAGLDDLRYDYSGELPALQALLARLKIDHVELHHFLDWDSSAIESITALGKPYDVYIHDYSWVCPRLTLLGGDGRYCGEPELAACETCIETHGSSLSESISVAELRRRSMRWLAGAREVIVPCADVASRLARYFPDLKPRVEPWEGAFERGPAPAPRAGSGPVRIAVIGAIGEQKGYQVLLDCARDAEKRKLPLEFLIIGHTEDDRPLFKTRKAFVTGRYEEAEIQDLLRRERPDLVFFSSVTPETWGYTLTHAVRSGLPIVAFELGAIAERLRAANLGVLIPLTTDPLALNERLLRVAAESCGVGPYAKPEVRKAPEGAAVAASAVLSSQPRPPAATRKDAQMDTIGRSSEQNGLTASVQVLTVPKGLYFFSVRSATPARLAEVENLNLPAVHVALGPGASAEQVEFVSGPDTNGTWLCEPTDTLIAKVKAASATLALTSVRAPGGELLAIELERLDSRVEARLAGTAALPLNGPVNQPLLGQPVAARLKPPETGTQLALVAGGSSSQPSLRVQIVAHVKNQGDLPFVDTVWAGRVGEGLWIEAFAITPLETLTATEIEYKALTASGFETPWLSDSMACGTRGMSVPLVGFAVRLKPKMGAGLYDCEYSGVFQSGTMVGPLRNGAPCRSGVPNDALEGIQLRIIERQVATPPQGKVQGNAVSQPPAAPRNGDGHGPTPLGPRFSKFRDEADPAPVPRADILHESVEIEGARAAKPAKPSRGSKSTAPHGPFQSAVKSLSHFFGRWMQPHELPQPPKKGAAKSPHKARRRPVPRRNSLSDAAPKPTR